MIDIFDKEFDDVLIRANNKYQLKKDKYGESWKDLSKQRLRKRFVEELCEWNLTLNDTKEELGELIDMINVLLMLATRVEKNENSNYRE